MGVGLDRSLQTCHRTVLAMIALFAILSAIQPGQADDAPDPTITTLAIVLGLSAVLTRRAFTSPVLSLRTRIPLLLCAYACSFGLAALGAFVALQQEQAQIGLMFTLAAGIFSLRPPPPLDSPESRTP
jgi:hypothetical protein